MEKPELVFSDLNVGKKFRTLTYPVTRDLVRTFIDVVGDDNPLYEKGLKEGAIAPPGLAAIYARLSYLQDHVMPAGGVLAKQEFEFAVPIRVGDTLAVNAEVVESYVDEKARKRVTQLIHARNQKHEVVTTIRLSVIWPK
jgi:acyl dehydratase